MPRDSDNFLVGECHAVSVMVTLRYFVSHALTVIPGVKTNLIKGVIWEWGEEPSDKHRALDTTAGVVALDTTIGLDSTTLCRWVSLFSYFLLLTIGTFIARSTRGKIYIYLRHINSVLTVAQSSTGYIRESHYRKSGNPLHVLVRVL